MSLTYELERTATWRATKAPRHPHDYRNAAAVDLLNALIMASADPKLEERYEALSNDVSSAHWSAVHSEVLGDIGFRWNPEHIDEVYLRIVNMLSNGTPMIVEMIREIGEKRLSREQAAMTVGRAVNYG